MMRYRFLLLFFVLLYTCYTHTLYAQREPEIKTEIGADYGDSADIKSFIAQSGVRSSEWLGHLNNESSKVDSFTFMVVRDTSIVLLAKNKGNYFSEEIKNFFEKLKAGDKILVFDIYVTMVNKRQRLTSPLEYILK